MVQHLNQFIQRWMPILTPLSLVIGVLLEQVGTHLLFLVPILFAGMTFISSLNLKFRDIKVFNAGMRNIAVGVVLATTYFPSKVAMPVVFGMLFQQVLASVFYKIKRTINN